MVSQWRWTIFVAETSSWAVTRNGGYASPFSRRAWTMKSGMGPPNNRDESKVSSPPPGAQPAAPDHRGQIEECFFPFGHVAIRVAMLPLEILIFPLEPLLRQGGTELHHHGFR